MFLSVTKEERLKKGESRTKKKSMLQPEKKDKWFSQWVVIKGILKNDK